MFGKLGRPLRDLGRQPRAPKSLTRQPRAGAVKFKAAAPRYDRIKQQVLEAIARLPVVDRWKIPSGATLPELIVALVLCWLRLPFQAQVVQNGGRLFLGGGVVDFLVQLGGRIVVVRIQGDYWHSLPGRKLKDAVQWDRLHAKGYRVVDLWELAIYQAWVDGTIIQFVRNGIENAA